MNPEDLAQMGRRHNQEHLLHRSGFEPVLPDGRELFMRDPELYRRGRALVVALEKLAAHDRGSRSFADSLTIQRDETSADEREESVSA